ncbi:hypothetical protein SLS62_007324 [Diatrype stigma]|uniref:Uncharacterized protein n=1 Tax=Diatrype stigma TaxID=117547 RepID=A0AAN9UP89_9PEZI
MTPLRTIFTRATASATASATRRAGTGAPTIAGRPPAAFSLPPAAVRTLHQTAAARYAPYKDDMDRESVKPKAHENTASGTDDEVAQDSEAFDPDVTDPDAERASAASHQTQQSKDDGGAASALEGTPANADVADQKTGAKEDRAPGGAGDHKKPSKRGKPFKKGRIGAVLKF